jgi:hypothetical protein
MQLALAYLTLIVFPVFALLVFQRFSRAQAAAIVVLAGSILLPERVAIDFPGIPPFDKEYITYLSALIAAYVFRKRSVLSAQFFRGLEAAVLLIALANIGTAYMNPEPLFDEGVLESGLSLYWVISKTGADILTVAIPFFVGRALFTSLADLYVLMRTMAMAAAAYTGLVALEVLMSIPFRSWQFSQVIFGLPARVNMRWGAAQPVVFFDNGLALATFMAIALIASAAIAKAGLPLPRMGRGAGAPRLGARVIRNLLWVGLLMTRNVAGVVYGSSFLLSYLFMRPRIVLMCGVSLVTLACIYPALRMADLFPYETLVEFARGYDVERARSFEGRFLEEEHVLGQIGDRLWLGWGTISRTPGAETFGRGEQGLDGWWTIRLGSNGIIGVVLYYMMFAIPVFRALPRLRLADRAGQILLGGLICMISVRMIDLIINGWWNCLPVFLAGVLSGVAGNLKRGDRVLGRRPGRHRSGPPPLASPVAPKEPHLPTSLVLKGFPPHSERQDRR